MSTMNDADLVRKALLRASSSPRWFIENFIYIYDKGGEFIKFKLNKAQVFVLEEFMRQLKTDKRVRLIVLKSRQQGISTLVRAIMLWYAVTHTYKGVVVAQRQSVLQNSVFRALKEMFNDCTFPLRKNNDNTTSIGFSYPTKSFIKGDWAQNKGELRSYTYNFCHLTEVESYENWQRLWSGVYNTVPREKSVILIESTANGHGVMWDLYNRTGENSEFKMVFLPWYLQDEYAIHGTEPLELTDAQRAIQQKHGLSDAQMRWYAQTERALGSHLAMQHEYPTEIEDSFHVNKDNTFFDFDVVEAASRREKPRNNYGTLYLGIDLAVTGDNTVMVWRRGFVVEHIEVIPPQGNVFDENGKLTENASKRMIDAIVSKFRARYAEVIFMDASGLGLFAVNEFRRYGMYVRGVNFGSKAEDADRYINKRAELYGRARVWLNSGGCIPDDKNLKTELQNVRYVSDKQLEKKELLKQRIGHSPDTADAFVLTFESSRYELGAIGLQPGRLEATDEDRFVPERYRYA